MQATQARPQSADPRSTSGHPGKPADAVHCPDFETFRSCARKPFDFYDRWTTQYPQNNLSTMQAAQAYLKLAREVVGRERARRAAAA